MDLALAVIPVHMIWGLKMPLKRKIGLCFLLSTGVLYVPIHFRQSLANVPAAPFPWPS